MSNQHKVTTTGKPGQYWGVAVEFGGLVSLVRGPHPTRQIARRAIEDAVANEMGGEEFHRVKLGVELPNLKAAVGGDW